ncbi:flavodoxin domain-containing protein [Enteractinococcus fodinae]|uniref:Menaquinone-dependent protoporphyrinogen IX oxidase n=1 Tax=Enteractinococcus fodinae TaxID=684663 RepID=A0ABU2B553_9MICC|nr:flavodoxin domain-containing protein [Enteractinococcus fodinae]MDR7347913.1 menaquinone-dependent protoporphyrinogen IX oxidase [Enteractinococcus fodinae]
MTRAVVVYRSEYGATQQYAQWLAVDLWCDVFDRRSIRLEDMQEYDTIIYGAPLRAGGKVLGCKFLRKEIEMLGDKNLILFTCGISDPEVGKNRRLIQDWLIKNLTDEVLAHIKVFHLRGAIDYKQLSGVHTIAMAMRKRTIARLDPAERTPEEQTILDTYRKTTNFVDRDAIRPMVKYVLQLSIRGIGPNAGASHLVDD